MARTTDEIIATMDAEQAAQTELAALNSTSRVSIFKLTKYISAQCANLLEQLWDAKETQLEALVSQGAPSSLYWLRAKAFDFQYGDTLELVDFIPQYPVIDTSKQIVTRCTIYQGSGAVVYVQVAKNEPPEKFSAPELAAIQDYYTNTGDGTTMGVGVGYGGQVLTVQSLDPDLLFLEAEITYRGNYANVIEDNCITAIENYISNVGVANTFRTIDLIQVLRGVDGFVDINIENLSARDAATAWLSGTDLVTSYTTALTEYTIAAGYMIGETTAGQTFADKLTFTAI